MTVSRYLTHQLKNKGLIWAHKLKIPSIRVGKIYDGRNVRHPVTFFLQSIQIHTSLLLTSSFSMSSINKDRMMPPMFQVNLPHQFTLSRNNSNR